MAKYWRVGIGFFLTTLFLTLFVAGCRRQVPPTAASKPAPTPAGVNDTGDLKLRVDPRKKRRPDEAAHKVGENEPAIRGLLADLNDKLILPFDLTVAIQDCGEANAYYDPDTHEVIICREMIDDYYYLFGEKIKDPVKLDNAVRGATSATFFHELGHALVDAWKIPITGKEEDAVDQLSTLVLLGRTDSGEQMALAGAKSFQLYADYTRGEKKVYWDEHSLDEQRFYDTICMIYGRSPDKFAYLIDDGTLPDERAANCPADFERIDRSWRTLLAPYLKQAPAK